MQLHNSIRLNLGWENCALGNPARLHNNHYKCCIIILLVVEVVVRNAIILLVIICFTY